MAATAERITELTAFTTLAGADLLCLVDDVAGTPTTKKMTVTNFFATVPVNIVQGNALNIQTDKVRARDGDGLYLVDDGDNGLFIADGGVVFIGDTANTKMTLGLTINQGANDDDILALKSSDVNHGFTDRAEADTFGQWRKYHATDGGMNMEGITAGIRAFLIYADATTNDGTKSAAADGSYVVVASKLTGATIGANDANANIIVFKDYSASRFVFDAEGEMHSDDIIGIGDDWDEWDDLALASDLSRLPKAKFDEMMKYKAEDFERAGLLTLSVDENGNRHAFIRHKAFLQFYACCFADVFQRFKAQAVELATLKQRVQLLGV